ncbi:MAG TPA: transcription termination factor Rho [Acidimicrobiales bacterium]|nr:transcription termination factor Rho [Acidimicrobiales bacterium]
MSVEPSALERSALERKDREELTTIAQALGAKPPSRARKAEIIQLILELTGVEPAGEASGGRSASPRAAGSRRGAARGGEQGGDEASAAGAGPAETSAGDGGAKGDEGERLARAEAPQAEAGRQASDEPAAAAAPPAGGPDEEPPSEWELEVGAAEAPEAATGGRPSGDGDRATRAGGNGDGQQGGRASGGQQAQQAQGGGQQQGQQQQGQQKAETPDAPEPGNRRRRRRGRRGKDDQSHTEDFAGEPAEVEGLLDLREEGYGFLRVHGYLPSKDDVYVSVKQVRQFGLRRGDVVRGASRPALRNEKNPALMRIDKVNGLDPEQARDRRRFEDLTPLFPDERLALETGDPGNMTARIVDLIAPIGKGQRGLIVSPPKAGKTAIVKQIARSIETNNPEVKLMVLLVDERPEEVTDMRRWLRNPESEVVASTFDRPAEEHIQVAELTIERAKRMVEDGRDVCIILDGITRLARAYNLAAPGTGRIMSGGVDSGALYPPKRFFGAARNLEEGGSLTILATALVETGSKMDEVIFEEFKGTGNMELRLDRRLAERRIYPAIDVEGSSTRHEELLFPPDQLKHVWALRRVLSGLSSAEGGNAAALEMLIERMRTFRTNAEFLDEVARNRLAAV